MALTDADRELMELHRSIATQGHAAGLPSGAAGVDPTAITTWEARRAAQREAYGQFVALGPIHIGNTLAFHTGQAVPLEHVIRYDLEGQELVARVATPELARVGKTFASDEEYYAANPHVTVRQQAAPEVHPAALDPRGAAAHLDTEGRHGEVVGTTGPADPGGDEGRRAKAGDVASRIAKSGDEDEAGTRKGTAASKKAES